MNEFRKANPDAGGKWERTSLKSSWYDANEGDAASALETVENRLRATARTFTPANPERVASADVERFFDLFDATSEQ